MLTSRHASRRTLSLALIAASGLGFGHAASAATLAAGNASATVSNADGGLTVFRVDGGSDNVFLANFFFRTDAVATANGGEVKLNALGPVTVSTPSANRVVLTAAGSGLAARQEVTLTGGPAGSGNAALLSTFRLTNTGDAPTDLELFYAADFDLDFDQRNPDDVTTAIDPSAILVADGRAELLTQAAPTASLYEIYQSQFEVLFNFNANTDGATTLSNTPGIGVPVRDQPGVTDAGFAFNWDRTLGPGESFSTFVVSTYTVVPEPASLALLGLGGIAMLSRRRAIPG